MDCTVTTRKIKIFCVINYFSSFLGWEQQEAELARLLHVDTSGGGGGGANTFCLSLLVLVCGR